MGRECECECEYQREVTTAAQQDTQRFKLGDVRQYRRKERTAHTQGVYWSETSSPVTRTTVSVWGD
jgi:hypothetical protein